ncbi:MAG: MarR family transcriptional regulator [Dehalococcoidales bacterium]|nr:MarR family transcriptional regulator [Dehalococcoidales bacterium]
MSKQRIIDELLGLQQQMDAVIAPIMVEFWRKLDVPLAQLKSLLIISFKGDTNYKSLANELGVTPGDVTRIVERLVEQGLVIRVPDPGDRRVTRLQATEKGRELLTNLMESKDRNLSSILEYMQKEDLEYLLRGTSALLQALKQLRKQTIKKE